MRGGNKQVFVFFAIRDERQFSGFVTTNCVEESRSLSLFGFRESSHPCVKLISSHILRVVIRMGFLCRNAVNEPLVMVDAGPWSACDIKILQSLPTFRRSVSLKSISQRLIAAPKLARVDLIHDRSSLNKLVKRLPVAGRELRHICCNLCRSEPAYHCC